MVGRLAVSALAAGLFCLFVVAYGSVTRASSAPKGSLTPASSWRCTSPFSPCHPGYHVVIPKPFRVSPSLQRQARVVLRGYSRALIDHNVSRARSFLTPHSLWRGCDQYLGHKARYLRCLLSGTPLPLHYEIGYLERSDRGSKDVETIMSYYFHPPGHPNGWRFQPFYLTLRPSPRVLRIIGGGLPRG